MSTSSMDKLRMAQFLYWFDAAFVGAFLMVGGLPIAAAAEIVAIVIVWSSFVKPLLQRSVQSELPPAKAPARLGIGLRQTAIC